MIFLVKGKLELFYQYLYNKLCYYYFGEQITTIILFG